ncbi:MAG: hypothetical protein QOF63_1936 [Thermoanaerobaculia bacterium]|jgi:hypothetical protein|nr:hypothetical protein [Thermoanaerobaculia bacterium]
MSAAAEQSLRGRTRVRNNSSRASVDAMAVRSARNAAVVARSSNVRRNSNVLRSSRLQRRRSMASGRENAAVAAAVEVAAKNPLRM